MGDDVLAIEELTPGPWCHTASGRSCCGRAAIACGAESGVGHCERQPAWPNGPTVVQLAPASLSDVFSTLDVTASGTLGDATASTASVRAHSASLGPFAPKFSCNGSWPAPQINVDLSGLRYIFDLNFPHSIDLFVGGTPRFSVNFNAPAQLTCTAALNARIPLGDTGLFLDIGPQFSLATGGQVSAGFTWDPKITIAFFRSNTGSGNYDIHQITNQGGVAFGGSAGVSLGLALSLGVDVYGAAGWMARSARP
jgi:hypothetical protein